MVHYILDFSEASHYIYEDGSGRAIDRAEFDSVILVLDSIEVKPAGKESVFYPAQDVTIKLFEKDRQFGRIFNRFPLPEGDYEFLKVHLKGGPGAKYEHPHTVKVADTVYQLDFTKKRLQFSAPFKVEAGRLTTLHGKPSQHKVIHYQVQRKKYRSQLELRAEGYTVTWPIEKIRISMKSVLVTHESGEKILLSDEPTRFELLSLRDTFVLLVGNEMVPAGKYLNLVVELDSDHGIQLLVKLRQFLKVLLQDCSIQKNRI